MAATFVVETGSVITGANSYATIAQADQYHENYGNPSAWSALADADKQEALRKATQYLDARYKARWQGRKVNSLQPLLWPRSFVEDSDGIYIAADEIPQELIDAVSILALISLTDTLRPDVAAKNSGISSESKGVGPLKTSVTYIGSKPTYKTYTLVHDLVRSFLHARGSVRRA